MASTAAADSADSVVGTFCVAAGWAAVDDVVPALGATVAAVLVDCSSVTRTGSDTVVVSEVSVTEAAGVAVVSWTSSVDCETAEVSTADSSGRPPRVSTCLRRASFSWLRRRSSTTISSRKSSTSSWS